MNGDLISLAVTGVFSVLWWLLRQKDESQAQQLKLLFEKHDKDARELQDLRVEIAGLHYTKPEVDSRFEKLEFTFKSGFDDLGRRFDRLSDVMIEHMREEVRGNGQ